MINLNSSLVMFRPRPSLTCLIAAYACFCFLYLKGSFQSTSGYLILCEAGLSALHFLSSSLISAAVSSGLKMSFVGASPGSVSFGSQGGGGSTISSSTTGVSSSSGSSASLPTGSGSAFVAVFYSSLGISTG